MRTKLLLTFLLLATLGGTGFSDEPVPSGDAITAKVDGDGTRKNPFVFTLGSLGKLSVTGEAKWNLDDCPIGCEVIGGSLLFPTDSPGEYHTFLEGKSAHAWFVIKSGNSPPVPVVDTVASRVTKAFVGPDAKADAAKWVSMWKAVRDELPRCADTADFYEASVTSSSAVGFPAGRYPSLAGIMRDVLPKEGTNDVLNADLRASLAAVLGEFIKGGEAVK